MKNLLLTIFLSIAALTSFAQADSTRTKVYRNEFGIDATGFVKQFLNFNQGQFPEYYMPVYYLTYRRHFKVGNIRFAVGGDFVDQDIPASFPQDSNKYHRNSYEFSARLGWEFFTDLSKRWQVYYGVDFRPFYAYDKNDVPYWNGGYANGRESKTQIYGVAPMLGFRFKMTSRLSLTTETNFSINWQQTESRRYYIPVTSQFPPLPDEVTPTTKKVFSYFSQPLSLIITFDI